MQPFNDSRDWFCQKRFGLFIHLGLYAIKGWYEQEIWRWPVAKSDYVNYLNQFNPVHFNADEWLDHAESAPSARAAAAALFADPAKLEKTKLR